MSNIDNIVEPTEADLALAAEDEAAALADSDFDWESLLPAPITAKESDDFWNEDENVHDDRWDSGIPSWSAWA